MYYLILLNQFKFLISILNWNVRGLGDTNKCTVIKDVTTDNNSDLICFQETKLCECSIFEIRRVYPSKVRHFISLNAEGTRGGILLAWSNVDTQLDSFILNYSMAVILKRDELTFMCTEVYGPQEDSQKRLFLVELACIRATNNLPWLY